MIAARAIQGAGAALLVPNSLALLNHAYADEKERGRAVGIWAAGASVALTAGPLVGGGLIALVGWRSLFGGLVGRSGAFMRGARDALVISAVLLLGAAVVIALGGRQADGTI